jgi:hypothetical protein
LQGWLERFAARHGDLRTTSSGDDLLCEAPDGASARLWLPWGPLPEPDDALAAVVAYHLTERTVGALLVRRRAHAVGVFRGTELLQARRDHHYVQSRTKAGGWSQQRYARRRSNQAAHAFGEAADDAATILLPRLDELEALVCGGDRAAVRTVLETHGLEPLRDLAARTPHPVLPVADPNAGVLAAFAAQFRSVRIGLNDLA